MAYNRDNRGREENNAPEYIEKVVYLNRVSKTVKGGRIFKFAALVVVCLLYTSSPLPARRWAPEWVPVKAPRSTGLPL